MTEGNGTRGPYNRAGGHLFRKVDGQWQRLEAPDHDGPWKKLRIDPEQLAAQKANMQFDSTAAWHWV